MLSIYNGGDREETTSTIQATDLITKDLTQSSISLESTLTKLRGDPPSIDGINFVLDYAIYSVVGRLELTGKTIPT